MATRTKPGAHQVNWWLPDDVLAELKEYQHDERMDHLRDAAEFVMREGLKQLRGKAKGGK